MKREEAIKLLKQYQGYDPISPDGETLKHAFDLTDETVDTLLTALRPVSRERVEKVWIGEWIWNTSGLYPKPVCSKCGEEPYRRSNHTSDLPNYCPKCGRPMTDEAVDILLKRLEALEDGKDD